MPYNAHMATAPPEAKLESYYKREPEATEKAILAFLRDSRNPHMVVYGAKALNAHLPDWLDKETKDWDIFTAGSAEEMAGQLERKLDKRYGGDFFSVEPALHPGTFRIRSKVTGAIAADVSLKDKEVEFKRIEGINYATLDWLENEATRLVNDPETAFRRSKDRDTLQRIRVFRGHKRRKRTKSGGDRYIDNSRVDTSMQGLRY